MAKKVLVNLDLSKNQILNVALQNLASAPSAPVDGQVYYNTSDGNVYYWDGTLWRSVSGDITEVIAGAGLVGGGSSGAVTLDLNPDNTTIEVNSDIVRIKDLGVGTNKIADSAVTAIKVADSNITFSKIQNIATMTVIGRVDAGSGVASSISIIDSNTMSGASSSNLATAGSIKAYVDSSIANIGNLEGAFAAGSSTDFPVGAGGTIKGDYWYVTSAGTVQGVVLNIGDVIIANKDNASVTSSLDWIFLESNRDQATESILGVIRLATQSETNAGVDDTTAVTPLKLKNFIDTRVGGFAANIGNGSATSYVVNHSLNTIDVIVMIKDNSTLEEVIADVVITDANNITVSFATAPANNAYRVIIKK